MSIDVNTTFDNVFKSPTADFTTVLMVFVPRRNPRVFDCLHHATVQKGSVYFGGRGRFWEGRI